MPNLIAYRDFQFGMNLLSAVGWTQLEHAKRGRQRIIETAVPHWRLTMILEGVEAGESSTAVESFSKGERPPENAEISNRKQQRNKVGAVMHMRWGSEKWTAGRILKVEIMLEDCVSLTAFIHFSWA